MLPQNTQYQLVARWLAVQVGLLGLLLFALPAHAFSVSSASATEMLQSIALQVPNLMRLITASAYVIGMYFIIIGVVSLKHMGELRTMMSHEHTFKTPLVQLTIGTLLLYLPSSIQSGLTTFWTAPNPYGYLTLQDQWSQFAYTCLSLIQLFGVLAFIRGLVILNQLSGHHQQGALGRGLTHIIGGIFCINIYQFAQVIMVTLGLTVTF